MIHPIIKIHIAFLQDEIRTQERIIKIILGVLDKTGRSDPLWLNKLQVAITDFKRMKHTYRSISNQFIHRQTA